MKTKNPASLLGLALTLALFIGCSATNVTPEQNWAKQIAEVNARMPKVDFRVDVQPADATLSLFTTHSNGSGFHPFLYEAGEFIKPSTRLIGSGIFEPAILVVRKEGYRSQMLTFVPNETPVVTVVLRGAAEGALELTPPESAAEEFRLATRSREEVEADRRVEQAKRKREMTRIVGDYELYWDYASEEYPSTLYTRIAGTVKNLGERTIARLPVRVDVWDEKGKAVINSDWTFAVDTLPLRPGETRRWEISVQKPTPTVSVSVLKPMDKM